MNFGDWSHSTAQTLEPKGAVAFGAEDAWEAVALMLEGLEHSTVHKEA